MAVYGVVGIMGSGKTQWFCWKILQAVRQGYRVYSTFPVGHRVDAALLPCDEAAARFGDRCEHAIHSCPSLVPVPMPAWEARRRKLDHGRMFLPFGEVERLGSFAELKALRARRDYFGRPVGKPVKVFIDEAQSWFFNRDWQDADREMLLKFAHVRKHHVELWWSSQVEDRIDVVLRDVTAQIYNCKRIGGKDDGSRRPLGYSISRWSPVLVTAASKEQEISDKGKVARGFRGREWSWVRPVLVPSWVPLFVPVPWVPFRQWVADAYDTYEDAVTPPEVGEKLAARAARKRARASGGTS